MYYGRLAVKTFTKFTVTISVADIHTTSGPPQTLFYVIGHVQAKLYMTRNLDFDFSTFRTRNNYFILRK